MATLTAKKRKFKFDLSLYPFDADTGEIDTEDDEVVRTITIDLPSNYEPSSSTTTYIENFKTGYMTNFANGHDTVNNKYYGSLLQKSGWMDSDINDDGRAGLTPLACATIQASYVEENITYYDVPLNQAARIETGSEEN